MIKSNSSVIIYLKFSGQTMCDAPKPGGPFTQIPCCDTPKSKGPANNSSTRGIFMAAFLYIFTWHN